MREDYVPFYVRKDDRIAFLACLALGTLYAIRQGVLPAEAGIWTLGRPQVRAPLEHEPGVPAGLIEVLSTSDELDAIKTALPHEFEAIMDKLIARLETVLASTGQPYWLAGWSLPPGDESSPLDEPT